ncbi:MAG: hypothetical protein Ct9H300mP16_17090 [Pseudomonadota bacterium]|nr:MAG: hypothetical protein Ct9H300mP16_17090 [Pseudomonadota bacterium]
MRPALPRQKRSVYQRDDGFVMIDPDKARGKKEIVDTCPYGAIWWNEGPASSQKWNFDAHLLDRGETRLRCEQVCPTNVFRSLKVEKQRDGTYRGRRAVQTLHPESRPGQGSISATLTGSREVLSEARWLPRPMVQPIAPPTLKWA